MLDIKEVIKGLQIERECVSRDCDRDCGKCDLVQERDWLLAVYDDAIELLKEQESEILKYIEGVAKLVTENERLKALLKEQEPVEPIPPTDESDLWKCGNCNRQLFRCIWQRYCPYCGREVKWDD